VFNLFGGASWMGKIQVMVQLSTKKVEYMEKNHEIKEEV
jgi:hypothetical protein